MIRNEQDECCLRNFRDLPLNGFSGENAYLNL